MKYLKYILILSFLVSCKSKKNIIDTNEKDFFTAQNIINNHEASKFSEKTVDAKWGVLFKNEKLDIGFSVRMKIKKDEVIWLKGTKFITVFKAKITPTKVQYYSPYKKDYFEGDFTMLKKLLGTDINFEQLQNMLLGQTILDVTQEKHVLEKTKENNIVLSPRKQNALFDILYYFNKKPKLVQQSIINSEKNQRLDILYPKYLVKDKVVFPENIQIKAKANNKYTEINMMVKSVVFNTDVNTSFTIPNGYKQITL